MDGNGYPTPETLLKIGLWSPLDFKGLAAFLAETWHYPNYVNYDNPRVLDISTGGWSGHEELISAIPVMWKHLHFWSKRRGGHWVFTQMGHNPDEV